MSTDTLTLLRMRFMARHGVFREEAERAQPFEVTAKLHLPLAEAGRADDLNKSVDYCAVQRVVRAVIEGPPRKLIETLAEAIATELLQKFSAVRAVEVEVLKLSPPVDFEFGGVAASVRRERKS